MGRTVKMYFEWHFEGGSVVEFKWGFMLSEGEGSVMGVSGEKRRAKRTRESLRNLSHPHNIKMFLQTLIRWSNDNVF